MQKRLTDIERYDNLRLTRDEKARGEVVRIVHQSNMADKVETDSVVERKSVCCMKSVQLRKLGGLRNLEQAVGGKSEGVVRHE